MNEAIKKHIQEAKQAKELEVSSVYITKDILLEVGKLDNSKTWITRNL